jgi:hypothetical protein
MQFLIQSMYIYSSTRAPIVKLKGTKSSPVVSIRRQRVGLKAQRRFSISNFRTKDYLKSTWPIREALENVGVVISPS